jgi:putative transposase
MCEVLQLPRSTYYKPEPAENEQEQKLEQAVVDIFTASRNNYGTRKIKFELRKMDYHISRRKIGRIMNKHGLDSTNYTVAQYKPCKRDVNESKVKNELGREFKQDEPFAVVVSDLTYVRVAGKWHYVCLFVDLFNREMIGFSSGPEKTAKLVYRAIASLSVRLDRVKMFHTDRGSEFDNKLISEALETFKVKR